MKTYTVLVGLLIGFAAAACSENDAYGICLDSAYCQDTYCPAAESCPNGRTGEPYCAEDDRCECFSCVSGTGGTGGSGNPGACADCVGLNDAAPGSSPNLTTSCVETDDPNACDCENEMGGSSTHYLSSDGCI